MTNEYRVVPVEPTEEMLTKFGDNCDGLDLEGAKQQWAALLAAATETNFKGLPSRDAYVARKVWEVVTRLQAEVETLKTIKARSNETICAVVKERDALKAELEEVKTDFDKAAEIISGLQSKLNSLRKALADTESDVETIAEHNIELQSELTKAREVLTESLSIMQAILDDVIKMGAVSPRTFFRIHTVLAHQSAPAAKDSSE